MSGKDGTEDPDSERALPQESGRVNGATEAVNALVSAC